VSENGIKVIATNRKARHEYHIHDTLEAGLVLTGTEIKSIRAGQVSIQEAYVTYHEGEMWLLGMHIAPYEPADRENHEVRRPRKLLMHARQIARWGDRTQQKGFTIVPLRLYLRRGRAKVEIALARGKKLYDKRQSLARKESERRMDRALSDHRKGKGRR
jgi:SsrA-binding protein